MIIDYIASAAPLQAANTLTPSNARARLCIFSTNWAIEIHSAPIPHRENRPSSVFIQSATMSVALQADLVVAGIFVFEKAVALGSYWLSEGVVRPGWAALLAAVHSMEVSERSTERAVRHIKRIQNKFMRAGSWLFDVRDGDMVTAVMEHRPSRGLLGLLLPITALLSPEQAATVLVEITKEDWLSSADQDQTALIPHKRQADIKDMSFETAHNIIAAVTPYVGHGYERV